MQTELVSLANLAGGAAIERFDYELAKVLDNIADPNTKTKCARTITLTVSIVPSEDRSVGSVEIDCKSKLANMNPAGHAIYLVQEGRHQRAYQRREHQGELFPENVTELKAKEG